VRIATMKARRMRMAVARRVICRTIGAVKELRANADAFAAV
jgi:hypothetical protein